MSSWSHGVICLRRPVPTPSSCSSPSSRPPPAGWSGCSTPRRGGTTRPPSSPCRTASVCCRWGRRDGTPWSRASGSAGLTSAAPTPASSRRCPRSRPASTSTLPPGNRRSSASGAVDLLALQVGVAQVAALLLHHVQEDQAERHDLAVVGELIVQGRRRPRRRRRSHAHRTTQYCTTLHEPPSDRRHTEVLTK